MKKLITLLFLVLTQTIFSATTIQGYWNWDMSIGGVGQEVNIIDTLFIQPGKTLTIKPGTKVNVRVGALVNVYGAFVAKGTAENPITFDWDGEGGYNEWCGFTFDSTSLDTANTSIFEHVTIKHAEKGDNGGAFYINNFSNIEFNNVTIDSCIADTSGGAIYADSSDIVLDSCFITNNKANYRSGGGIFTSGGSKLVIIGTELKGNSSSYFGGGLYASSISDSVVIKDCTINSNSASGIYINNPKYSNITSSEFTNNRGYGLSVSSDSTIISDIKADSNSTSGIYINSSKYLNITSSEFTNNRGTGLMVSSDSTIISDIKADSNYGIGISVSRHFNIDRVSSSSNIATNGAGVYISGGAEGTYLKLSFRK